MAPTGPVDLEKKMETTIMENQMEKKMENEMETGIILGLYWGYMWTMNIPRGLLISKRASSGVIGMHEPSDVCSSLVLSNLKDHFELTALIQQFQTGRPANFRHHSGASEGDAVST